MHALVNIAGVRFGADGGYDNSSSGGSSSVSSRSGSSYSSGSSTSTPTDGFRHELRELWRNSPVTHGGVIRYDPLPGPSYSCPTAEFTYKRSLFLVPESTACVLDDIEQHLQRMLPLLPAFSEHAGAGARADALFLWFEGFGVGWVLDMDTSGGGDVLSSLPRRELCRRVSAWSQALSTMEHIFRLRHWRFNLGDAHVVFANELVTASAGAMLNLADAVAAVRSSPRKLLATLDVYAPVSEAFPALAMNFSWDPSHPVLSAAKAKLAGLVDAARSCLHDLRAFIRSHYTWRMPKSGEVHPCVRFWMDYFCCLLRSRVYLYIVLSDDDEGRLNLAPDLISCLEAVLGEKSAKLAFPGLRQLFMLNNTFAIVRRAVRSDDLKLFLPPEWVRVREERMEGYIKGYLDASWAPVVSRLDGSGMKLTAVLRRRNRLSTFYSALENACSAQRGWKVPNPVLRGVLRKTVSENVVPPYRRYLEDHPEIEVASEHTAEVLEQQLSDLFEG